MDERLIAIPTIIDGIKFRSRLEAAFWQWVRRFNNPEITITHEPPRIGRNQYLPDFLVTANNIAGLPDFLLGPTELGPSVYVEVKPVAFADKAWLAIDAAREIRADLMVVHDIGWDDWCCYTLVCRGQLKFFSTFEEHGIRVHLGSYGFELLTEGKKRK